MRGKSNRSTTFTVISNPVIIMVYTDLIWGGIIARPLHNEGGNLVPLWLFT